MCLPAGSTFKHHALICLIRDSEQSTKVNFDVILCVCNLKNTIKAGGSTAICKMLTGVGDGEDGVDTP